MKRDERTNEGQTERLYYTSYYRIGDREVTFCTRDGTETESPGGGNGEVKLKY